MKSTSLFSLFALALLTPVAQPQISTTSPIYTVAGGTFGDGRLATSIGIGSVDGAVTDNKGNLYFIDSANYLIRKVDTNGILTTVAGTGLPAGEGCCSGFPYGGSYGDITVYSGSNGDGRHAIYAALGLPSSLEIDNKGNLYFSDDYTRIRRIDTNGIINTVVGNGISGAGTGCGPELPSNYDFQLDNNDNIYILAYGTDPSGNQAGVRICKASSSGITTTIAGNGTGGFTGDTGPATNAEIAVLYSDLTVDGSGNIYFVNRVCNDFQCHTPDLRIRRIDTAGTIATYAGNGTQGFSGDKGPATSAEINTQSLALDNSGNLYLLENSASGNGVRIREVGTNGLINTIAGNGTPGVSGDRGQATSAEISAPYGSLALDAGGNIYFENNYHNGSSTDLRIRKVSTGGIINTVAGNGTPGLSGDGGLATEAEIDGGVDALDSSGNLYSINYYDIDGYGGELIRKVVIGGTISTIAGNGTLGFNGDGENATSAEIDNPGGLAVDKGGNLYIADYNNYRIRKVSPSGAISTIAGDSTDSCYYGTPCLAPGPAVNAKINSPIGVAIDSSGNLYFTNDESCTVSIVNPSGMLTNFAGVLDNCGYGGDEGPATSALLSYSATALAVDSNGNLYIGDSGNFRVRKVDTHGIITTFAGNGTQGYTGDGGLAVDTEIGEPAGLAVDGAGNLYIADNDNFRIRKVDTSGVITTVVGTGATGFSGDGGPAVNAQISYINGLAMDKFGNLYLADGFNNRVRKVDPSGTITTVTGDGTYGYSGDGGPASAAVLSFPGGLAVDSSGSLYIGDVFNYRVRKIVVAAPVPAISGISPNYGAPAALIKIAGTNFGATQGTSSVTVGGAPSHVVSWSNTLISITVPSNATTGNIVVIMGGKASNGAPFQFYSEPSISRLSVDSGPVGTPVTLIGSNLLDGEGNGKVTFNGTPAKIISQTESSIQVNVPSGATTGPVTAHINGVTVKSTTFTVTVPHISSISPNYGAPAAFINITGANFGATQGNSDVIVGDAFAQVTAWSDTAITIRVPSRASTGNLAVGVGGESSNGELFTFYSEPSITTTSGNSGAVGTLFTINGNNLLDGGGNAIVIFNGVPAVIISDTSSQIQVNVPLGATSGRVFVKVNGVTLVAATDFIVAPSTP